MRIGVIGAGPIGLCAVKHSLAFGCEVIAFEQSDKIGGTWVFTEECEKDKNGLEIHSSMYEGLRTNIPKEIMGFPDFPYTTPKDRSFMNSEEVLDYIKSYSKAFDLERHVRFEHQVIRVRPLADDSWEMIVHDLAAKRYETFLFDAVLVCNGFSVPIIPKFPGQKLFRGAQSHAHSYRNARKFAGQRILVIGAGPSGNDFTTEIAKTAEKIFWSHHMQRSFGFKVKMELPENLVEKPDVVRFTENGAEFEDGSFEEFTSILYCTGYDFKFPFLSVDCGITNDDKYVRPLYKHLISINRPTLAILGLPFFAVGGPLFDLCVRFCLTFITRRKQLPSREEMLEETEKEMEERWKTLPRNKAHFLGLERHAQYYEDLAKTAGIEPLKPVITKIFNKSLENIFANRETFRDYNFKITDDDNFEMTSIQQSET